MPPKLILMWLSGGVDKHQFNGVFRQTQLIRNGAYVLTRETPASHSEAFMEEWLADETSRIRSDCGSRDNTPHQKERGEPEPAPILYL